MPEPLPSVSIVTPTLGQAAFIEATIQSVLEQDYPRLEYFVADGGSTDGTLDLLRKYDSRLRWISQPDHGQADAINKGFAQTTGEILAWLNSDDTYAPGAVSAAANFFAAHPEVGVVYGNADFIDAAGHRIGRCQNIEPFSRHRLLYYSDFLVQPAVFFRRSVFESAGGLDPSLCWSMDYDLWLKLSTRTQFAFIPRVLANYRWLDTSKTGSGGRKRIDEVLSVVQRHGAPTLPAYFRLEAIRMDLCEALAATRQLRFATAVAKKWSAILTLCRSPRAIFSLLSLRTWRIICMGQIIRAHAAAAMHHNKKAKCVIATDKNQMHTDDRQWK
ncbi:MAG TPA: glycosyltransferase family 2 protein [Tepidisphaeraceae bacterium]|jgi:glycosyltransferase involved in cell wall biosynthesis|nr:glycosyltransferase family 2 protein [Tepidisphaeraceae bacterium]